jgi:hypothetical protein
MLDIFMDILYIIEDNTPDNNTLVLWIKSLKDY